MKVVLLAAGRGSRLGELTRMKPKCLVTLNGRPLLDWLVESLRSAGLRDFWLVTGYRSELLDRYDMSRLHNERWQETNMVGSLQCAAALLRENDTIVTYTDILYTPNTVKSLLCAHGSLALTYDPEWRALWSRRFEEPNSETERFKIDVAGRVTEIGGCPSDYTAVAGQYMGLLKFTPFGWKKLESVLASMAPEQRDRIDMTSLLSVAINQARLDVQATPAIGGWCEIDSVSDVLIGEDFVSNGLLPVLPVA